MRLRLLLLLVGLGTQVPEAGAQDIWVMGPAVQITVPFAGTGFGTGANASTTLQWTVKKNRNYKVTVGTVVQAQSYTLAVQAQNVHLGQSAGVVSLAAGSDRDLVVGIRDQGRPDTGQAVLRYTATATAGASAGTDQHTVVYTLTQQ